MNCGPAPTVAAALATARTMGVDRLDAQWLLARVLNRPRSWLLAHDEAPLDADLWRQFQGHLVRRAGGEPLAYLHGEKEFHGLTLSVNPAVLVPRPDTELLVDWALELLDGALAEVKSPTVADLGTGSGAIALAVKNCCPQATVMATDNSQSALAVAGANAVRLGLDVGFVAGSWWAALPGHRFHLVLSNPPYIAAGDPHLPALRHEPASALTPGGDGLGALQEIVHGAPHHLLPGGWLLLEHGFEQAEAVQGLLRSEGFAGVETRHDLGGQPRCSGGHR